MYRQLMDSAQGTVVALRRELEDEKKRHLRTLADFENFRRRVERESGQASLQGKKELARDLPEVLDNMELAIGQVKDEVIRQGLQLVYREFTGTLVRHGLEPVESIGRPFSPDDHEGAGFVENSGFPSGYVAQELRRGYRFCGELIRPATVRVAPGQVNEQWA